MKDTKVVGLRIPVPLYAMLKANAVAEALDYESFFGAVPRWIIRAIREKLERDGPPKMLNAPSIPLTEKKPPEEGSVEEAQAKIDYLLRITGPGQYPPVRARKMNELDAWRTELLRRKREDQLREPPQHEPNPYAQPSDIQESEFDEADAEREAMQSEEAPETYDGKDII